MGIIRSSSRLARAGGSRSNRSARSVVGVLAALGLLAAACGSDDTPDATPEAPATTASSGDSGGEATTGTTDDEEAEQDEGTESSSGDIDSLTEDELYALAQDEGLVTLYTPIRAESMDEIASIFNEQYPGIRLETVTLNVDELVSRINTEQRGGQYVADIVVNDGFRLTQLQSIDAIEPYDPQTKPDLLEGLETLPGFESVAFVTTRSVAYNPTVLEQRGIPEPTSLEDLTAPEWSEIFATTPHGVDIFTGMIVAYGRDKATEVLEGLGNNRPRLVESNSQSITLVQTGDIAAAITYGTYASPAKNSDPTTLDFFNTDPMLTTTYFQALATQSPNPAAARLFINWFGSPEGQQAMVDHTGFTSIRPDVENDPEVWNPEIWEPAFVSLLGLDDYNAQLEEYRTAMNVP